MGQKVNPISLRLGINKTWDSRWYAEKDYATLLHQGFCNSQIPYGESSASRHIKSYY